MSTPSAELQEKMRTLQVRYAGKLHDKLQEIQSQLQLCRAEPGVPAQLHLLYRQLHSVAGSAGTFGFTELGALARTIEYQVQPWVEAGATPQDLERVADALTEMRRFLPAQMP